MVGNDVGVRVKASTAQFVHKNVTIASFKDKVHEPGHFPINHSIWCEIMSLSMGQKCLHQFACMLHLV